MRWLLLFTIVSFQLARPEAQSPPPDPRVSLETMVAAERAFAQAAAQKGIRAAFLAFLDDDAIGFEPSLGRARDVWRARPVPSRPLATILSWEPRTGDVATAGDLGWLTGPYRLLPEGDAARAQFGCYLSVWRRKGTQPWRVLIDYGVRTPGPCMFPGTGFVALQRDDRQREMGGTSARGRDALLETDRKVSTHKPEDWPTSLLAVVHERARFHRPGRQPIVGLPAIREFVAAEPGPARLTSIDGDVAASGDLGYTYGRVDYTAAGQAPQSGYYFRLWRRLGSGNWVIVADVQKPIN
jgi:ketosteroid isomerase-like protein